MANNHKGPNFASLENFLFSKIRKLLEQKKEEQRILKSKLNALAKGTLKIKPIEI